MITGMNSPNMRRMVDFLDKPENSALCELMRTYGLSLAGGAIRDLAHGQNIRNDLDLFGNEIHTKRAVAFVKANNLHILRETDRYITFRFPQIASPIQIIIGYYQENLQNTLEHFDFTTVMGGVRYDGILGLVGYQHPELGSHILKLGEQWLSYNTVTTFLRAMRFHYRYGYDLPQTTLFALIAGLELTAQVRGTGISALLENFTNDY